MHRQSAQLKPWHLISSSATPSGSVGFFGGFSGGLADSTPGYHLATLRVAGKALRLPCGKPSGCGECPPATVW